MGCTVLCAYVNTRVRLCVSSRLQTSLLVLCRTRYAGCSNIFLLGTMTRTAYHDCMDNHNHTPLSRDDTDHHVSAPTSPLVSEMLPAFLDYLRVEEHRTSTTL